MQKTAYPPTPMEQSISLSGKKHLRGPLLLLITAPLLLFPDPFPRWLVAIALACLVLPFWMRRKETGDWLRLTPVSGSVLVLALLFLPLSFIISPLPWEVSWPRLTVLAWSVALFFTIINATPAEPQLNDPRMPAYLNVLTMSFLTGGTLAVFIGLLGMRRVDKLFAAAVPAPLEVLLGGFHPNELAGLITLFLPLAAALALRGWRTRLASSGQFIAWLGLTIFLAGSLLLTQSRTSLVAIGIALVLVCLLSGRRGWNLLAVGVIGVVVALLVVGVTRTMDIFVYAGANSWASVIGPRMRIWEQGWFALREFWPLGTGLGGFYAIAPHLYPQVPPGEAVQLPPAAADAHNLYLQTALDFGLPGLLLFLLILVLALGQLVGILRRDGTRGLSRAWAIGALGAAVAHLLYSLTDAVAFGSLSSIAFWFWLAMVMATTAEKRAGQANQAMLNGRWRNWVLSLRAAPGTVAALLLGGAAVLLFAVWQAPSRAVFANGYAAQRAAVVLTSSASGAGGAAEEVGAEMSLPDGCRVGWYQGLIENATLNVPARNASWERILPCAAEFIPFMAVLAPADTEMARLAAETQPESAAAHFWLAESVAEERPLEAIAAYETGLALAPEDGVRWQILGDMLIERDPQAAIAAYLQSCTNGDPGANGCWRAGNAAEQQGDMTAAIAYYRLSKWEVALQRADELESRQ